MATKATVAWRPQRQDTAVAAGAEPDIINYSYAASLPTLCARDGLAWVFMCCWPCAKDRATTIGRLVLTAPMPQGEWSQGQLLYRSEIRLPPGSPARCLHDAFGTHYTYSATDSHSGHHAPKTALSGLATGVPLFSEVVGPLGTLRACVEALLDGTDDVTGGDSFVMLLLRRNQLDIMARTRVVADGTKPNPAAGRLPGGDPAPCPTLRGALPAPGETATGRDLPGAVCLTGFIPGAPSAYDPT